MTQIDRIFNEFKDSADLLMKQGEVSLSIALDENLRKILILSAASYFEYRLSNIVLNFVEKTTQKNTLILPLIKQKVIIKQYHSWFDWESKNANKFFSMFGEKFKIEISKKIELDSTKKECMISFMSIGNQRNMIVHNDYSTYTIEYTPDELFVRYQSANRFIDEVEKEFEIHSNQHLDKTVKQIDLTPCRPQSPDPF
jgi:hypothetical protein